MYLKMMKIKYKMMIHKLMIEMIKEMLNYQIMKKIIKIQKGEEVVSKMMNYQMEVGYLVVIMDLLGEILMIMKGKEDKLMVMIIHL